MAARLGITRAAVWKQIRALRQRGYVIESLPRKGYRLCGQQDILDADAIRSGLETRRLGREMLCLAEAASTNDVARSMAHECSDGTVVLAETQIQGRGRLSRSWASPPGGIWMSMILKPQMALDRAYRINMAVSAAVSRSLYDLYGLQAGIKWPNDLLIRDRKVCGILMEVSAEVDRLQYAVVGIGINANVDVSAFPREWRTTSIRQELGREISRIELIQKLLLEIERSHQNMDDKETWMEWRRRSVTLGRRVRISSLSGDLSGLAEDLAEDGALLIRDSSGLHRVLAGDCIHLRPLEAA